MKGESNHKRCNVSLVDINSLNTIKTPIIRCGHIMSVLVHKASNRIRVTVSSCWSGILYPSSPSN